MEEQETERRREERRMEHGRKEGGKEGILRERRRYEGGKKWDAETEEEKWMLAGRHKGGRRKYVLKDTG